MKDGVKWGLIGIVMQIVYYIVSIIMITFISQDQTFKVFIFAVGAVFASLTIYAGGMAFKAGSRIFGAIDIILGIGVFIMIISGFIKAIQIAIANIPTF